MCPPVEDSAPNGVNGHTNGATNGTANGSGCEVFQSGGKTSLTAIDAAHDGFTAIPSSQNPHVPSRNPYQPIGDFLSNISRFSGFLQFNCRSRIVLTRSTELIESTLREGEQFATSFFDTEKKIEIARALDDFGVDYVCSIIQRAPVTRLTECVDRVNKPCSI